MAGGTDTHTGLAAAEEDNFFGKHRAPSRGRIDGTRTRMKFGDRVVKGWEMTAAGYTAVWATENTREAHLGRDEAPGGLRDERARA